jgi:hypothetical protein
MINAKGRDGTRKRNVNELHFLVERFWSQSDA